MIPDSLQVELSGRILGNSTVIKKIAQQPAAGALRHTQKSRTRASGSGFSVLWLDLAVKCGETVTIAADGPDEDAAIEELTKLCKDA